MQVLLCQRPQEKPQARFSRLSGHSSRGRSEEAFKYRRQPEQPEDVGPYEWPARKCSARGGTQGENVSSGGDGEAADRDNRQAGSDGQLVVDQEGQQPEQRLQKKRRGKDNAAGIEKGETDVVGGKARAVKLASSLSSKRQRSLDSKHLLARKSSGRKLSKPKQPLAKSQSKSIMKKAGDTQESLKKLPQAQPSLESDEAVLNIEIQHQMGRQQPSARGLPGVTEQMYEYGDVSQIVKEIIQPFENANREQSAAEMQGLDPQARVSFHRDPRGQLGATMSSAEELRFELPTTFTPSVCLVVSHDYELRQFLKEHEDEDLDRFNTKLVLQMAKEVEIGSTQRQQKSVYRSQYTQESVKDRSPVAAEPVEDAGVAEVEIQEEVEGEEEPNIYQSDNATATEAAGGTEGSITIQDMKNLALQDIEASLRFNERVFGDASINLENEQFYRHRHPLIHEFSSKEVLADAQVQEMYDEVVEQIKDKYARLMGHAEPNDDCEGQMEALELQMDCYEPEKDNKLRLLHQNKRSRPQSSKVYLRGHIRGDSSSLDYQKMKAGGESTLSRRSKNLQQRSTYMSFRTKAEYWSSLYFTKQKQKQAEEEKRKLLEAIDVMKESMLTLKDKYKSQKSPKGRQQSGTVATLGDGLGGFRKEGQDDVANAIGDHVQDNGSSIFDFRKKAQKRRILSAQPSNRLGSRSTATLNVAPKDSFFDNSLHPDYSDKNYQPVRQQRRANRRGPRPGNNWKKAPNFSNSRSKSSRGEAAAASPRHRTPRYRTPHSIEYDGNEDQANQLAGAGPGTIEEMAAGREEDPGRDRVMQIEEVQDEVIVDAGNSANKGQDGEGQGPTQDEKQLKSSPSLAAAIDKRDAARKEPKNANKEPAPNARANYQSRGSRKLITRVQKNQNKAAEGKARQPIPIKQWDRVRPQPKQQANRQGKAAQPALPQQSPSDGQMPPEQPPQAASSINIQMGYQDGKETESDGAYLLPFKRNRTIASAKYRNNNNAGRSRYFNAAQGKAYANLQRNTAGTRSRPFSGVSRARKQVDAKLPEDVELSPGKQLLKKQQHNIKEQFILDNDRYMKSLLLQKEQEQFFVQRDIQVRGGKGDRRAVYRPNNLARMIKDSLVRQQQLPDGVQHLKEGKQQFPDSAQWRSPPGFPGSNISAINDAGLPLNAADYQDFEFDQKKGAKREPPLLYASFGSNMNSVKQPRTRPQSGVVSYKQIYSSNLNPSAPAGGNAEGPVGSKKHQAHLQLASKRIGGPVRPASAKPFRSEPFSSALNSDLTVMQPYGAHHKQYLKNEQLYNTVTQQYQKNTKEEQPLYDDLPPEVYQEPIELIKELNDGLEQEPQQNQGQQLEERLGPSDTFGPTAEELLEDLDKIQTLQYSAGSHNPANVIEQQYKAQKHLQEAGGVHQRRPSGKGQMEVKGEQERRPQQANVARIANRKANRGQRQANDSWQNVYYQGNSPSTKKLHGRVLAQSRDGSGYCAGTDLFRRKLDDGMDALVDASKNSLSLQRAMMGLRPTRASAKPAKGKLRQLRASKRAYEPAPTDLYQNVQSASQLSLQNRELESLTHEQATQQAPAVSHAAYLSNAAPY